MATNYQTSRCAAASLLGPGSGSAALHLSGKAGEGVAQVELIPSTFPGRRGTERSAVDRRSGTQRKILRRSRSVHSEGKMSRCAATPLLGPGSALRFAPLV